MAPFVIQLIAHLGRHDTGGRYTGYIFPLLDSGHDQERSGLPSSNTGREIRKVENKQRELCRGAGGETKSVRAECGVRYGEVPYIKKKVVLQLVL